MAGHLIQSGRHRQRRSYARIEEVMELPNLIEIQQKSYQWFLDEGLREMFQDISPIQDFTGNLVLEFIDYSLGEAKYSVDETKERDVTYAAPLRVKVRLINKETGEVKEQEVFMGDFPLMTETGTFIINGAERVIVSQLVRSPSVYYSNKVDKNGKQVYTATVIPNRGAWLELETDAKDVIYVRIDRTRKIPVTVLLRALGYGSDAEILHILGEDEYIKNTLEKDNTESTEKALIEIYERLRPGEPPTVDNAKSLLVSRFFDPKRYDLANVGRYKINKKLHIRNRVYNQKLAETLVDNETGEILAEAGQTVDRRLMEKLEKYISRRFKYYQTRAHGGVVEEEIDIQSINIFSPIDDGKVVKVIANGNIDKTVKHITPADIIASINYFINLLHGIGNTDDIDHLGNRRFGLLENCFKINSELGYLVWKESFVSGCLFKMQTP